VSDYSGVGAGFRIVVLILLVGVLALGGLVWFDYLGVVDARRTLAPVFALFGAKRPELSAEVQQVEEREKAAEDREKLFNERVKAYDNRRENLVKNSAYLVGMPPDKAVKILLAMEDQDVIDLMRVTEEQAVEAGEASLVAYWLSLMPADRAATLQRKMARKIGG
jgi:flagellar protein FlbB